MCIKFGDDVNVNEIIKLNGSQIPWVKEMKHLGNYINKTLSHKLDCQYKLSAFIHVGSVNKFIVATYNRMLLLDYLNQIVAHSMVHKHGRLILLFTNVFVSHGIKMLEIFLSFLTELIHGC